MFIFLVLFIPFILNFENIYVSAGSDYGYQDIRSCKQGLAKLNKENEDLRRRLESLESKFDYSETDTNKKEQKLNGEIKELREQLEHIKNTLGDQRSFPRAIGDETPTLAFSVKLRNDMRDIANGQTIVFQNVDTNIGGRYNDQTGIFYCDKPGLYYFSINAMVHAGKYVELGLIINGNDKFRALADARGLSDFDTGSNSGVYKLQKGDSVWVRVGYRMAGHTGNMIYHNFTTFSGFLVSDEV